MLVLLKNKSGRVKDCFVHFKVFSYRLQHSEKFQNVIVFKRILEYFLNLLKPSEYSNNILDLSKIFSDILARLGNLEARHFVASEIFLEKSTYKMHLFGIHNLQFLLHRMKGYILCNPLGAAEYVAELYRSQEEFMLIFIEFLMEIIHRKTDWAATQT